MTTSLAGTLTGERANIEGQFNVVDDSTTQILLKRKTKAKRQGINRIQQVPRWQ